MTHYPRGDIKLIAYASDASIRKCLDNAQPNSYSNLDWDQNRWAREDDENALITLAPGQTLSGTGFSIKGHEEVANTVSNPIFWRDNHISWLCKTLKRIQEAQPSFLSVTLETQDVTRWRMAWQAFGKYEHLSGHVCRRSKDMPEIFDIIEEKRLMFGFSVAALVYGGLHALAWFAHFNTSIEQLLWRISACVVMGGLPVAFGLLALTKLLVVLEDWQRFSWDNIKYEAFNIVISNPWLEGGSMGICIILILELVIAIAYPLARVYLVVECFISLSHLPAGVYDVPDWAAYFRSIS